MSVTGSRELEKPLITELSQLLIKLPMELNLQPIRPVTGSKELEIPLEMELSHLLITLPMEQNITGTTLPTHWDLKC